MTLLEEVQGVMERTYAPVGVDLSACIVGARRSTDLLMAAGWPLEDRPSDACTFLRREEDSLYLAIFYSDRLIAALEAENPRQSISHRNIGYLISFLEEITHAVHAALAFAAGFREVESESFACALEAQAKVDTYWLVRRFCCCLIGRDPERWVNDWIMQRLFDDERFTYVRPELTRRYRLAHRIARGFVERTASMPTGERVAAIRAFRVASLLGKARLARGWV